MKTFAGGFALLYVAMSLTLPGIGQAQEALTPAEAQAIAKEAYIYGYPMVDSYRIQHAYFVDTTNPEYKGPWNEVHNLAHLASPADTTIQTPNADTLYSMLGLDLRAEPIVLTVPKIEDNRYFSIQLIDQYTFDFAYIGSRATGNGGGNYMIAGPSWQGDTPAGVDSVIRSETELALALYRTQLMGPDDLANVQAVQAGYKAQPLSSFLGTTAPAAAPAIDFITPLTPETQKTSTDFFAILNFLLQFAPVDPSETDLRARFATLGIVPGQPFDTSTMSPETVSAIEAGMADAWTDFDAFKTSELDTGKITAADLFGTREFLKNNYLYRMSAAILGIFGNVAAEAMYPAYLVDATGAALDGSKHSYTLHFAEGALPPVHAFWSVTMYEMPQSLLYANTLNRYLINSPMLPNLIKDADGGITLYVSHESPGADKEANWLPAPAGPFSMFMRLYWPEEAALNGTWTKPPLAVVAN